MSNDDATTWCFDQDGAEIVSGLVDSVFAERLRNSCPSGRAGVRNPLSEWPEGRGAARRARDYLTTRRGNVPLLTRAILFDKREDANWQLPLHRDLSIAVVSRVDVPGFGPWSVKAGQPHVAPPLDVLAQIVTVRLHLDDAGEQNGCLRVIPRTHLARGSTTAGDTDVLASGGTPMLVRAGDAVLMHPLVLHGSERSRIDARRRVLHMEFAFGELPGPLQWAEVMIDEETSRG